MQWGRQTPMVRRGLASAMKLRMPLPVYTNMSPFPWLSICVTCQHSSAKRMHMCIFDFVPILRFHIALPQSVTPHPLPLCPPCPAPRPHLLPRPQIPFHTRQPRGIQPACPAPAMSCTTHVQPRTAPPRRPALRTCAIPCCAPAQPRTAPWRSLALRPCAIPRCALA